MRWKHFTETGAIKAKAVIIAAGGFAMNPEMVAEYTPALGQERKTKSHGTVAPYILGNPNDDGLGIRLGVSAGGVATNLDQLFITAAAYPPEILLTGVIVNKDGKRFVAEDSYHSRTSAFVLEQPGQSAYPHRRRGAHADARDAADQVHRRLGDGRGDGDRARNPGRAISPRHWTATTRTRPRAKTRTSTSSRNTLRPRTRDRGRRSICPWAWRCTQGSRWAG